MRGYLLRNPFVRVSQGGRLSQGLILLFLISLFVMGCGSSGRNLGAQLTTIAFTSNRSLDGSDVAENFVNIWSMNSDGSGTRPLTAFKAAFEFALTPVWSPDGQKLAFLSNRALDGSESVNKNGTVNIWVMNSDGSGLHPLTKLTANFSGAGNSAANDVVWSPDGSKLAYDSFRALDGSDSIAPLQISNVWMINSDGTGSAPLTQATALHADSTRPAWSPDGRKIAFVSGRAFDGSNAANANGTANIWIMNPNGSGAIPRTKIDASFLAGSSDPVWSPDGSKLAFDSARALDGTNGVNNAINIWVMNSDGSGAVPLTKLAGVSASQLPQWSSDGSKLAYQSNRALDGRDFILATFTNVWVINSDGSGSTPVTRLTDQVALSNGQAWRPGRKQLAFSSNGALDGSDSLNSTDNIWFFDTDGNRPVPLTKLTLGSCDEPAWQPGRPVLVGIEATGSDALVSEPDGRARHRMPIRPSRHDSRGLKNWSRNGSALVSAEVLSRPGLGHSKRKIARDLHVGSCQFGWQTGRSCWFHTESMI